MAISNTRRVFAGVLLAFGIVFTLLALGIFAVPFISALTHSYEGGQQAIGAFILYLLLCLPACGFTFTAILLRGWREARAGYITLACLFGIPFLTFIVALIGAAYDSIHHPAATLNRSTPPKPI
jgi:hypothetical protein